MSFSQFFKVTIETFKPHRYKGLTQRTFMKSFLYFFTISLLYLFIISGINTTRYISNFEDNETGFSNLNTFDINLNIKTDKPIILSNYPLIILDSDKNSSNIGKEELLITNETLTKKVFFYEKSMFINNINLKELVDKSLQYKWLLIFIAPIILAFLFVFVLIKYLFIVFIVSLIGTLFLIFGENKAKISEIFKAGLYSIIIYYIGNIFSHFIHIKYIGLISYLIFFTIVLFLLKEDDRVELEPNNSDDEDDGF